MIFIDDVDRDWSLKTMSMLEVTRIRDVCKLNIIELDGETTDDLHDNHELLAEALWISCAKQAQTRGVSYGEFAGALHSDRARVYAIAALLEVAATYDFLQESATGLLAHCRRLRITINERATIDDEDIEVRLIRDINVAAATCIADLRKALSLVADDANAANLAMSAALDRFLESMRRDL